MEEPISSNTSAVRVRGIANPGYPQALETTNESARTKL
jgi:hypothetical protein